MENSKSTAKKPTTTFGSAILEALEKGRSCTSTAPKPTNQIAEISNETSMIDSLLKVALKKEESRKEKLAKRRAKINSAKANPPNPRKKLSEVENLKNQVSILTKSNNDLKKRISDILFGNSEKNKKEKIEKLLNKALQEIREVKKRNKALEVENETLRKMLIKHYAKTLDLKKETVFYGGQYSDPET